jgi:myo-inositol 2-dehydrogenase/D-chiro-inositol 1-dehydrogenase
MDKLRYGILGSGMMGQEHIKNLAMIEQCEVAALFDSDAGMCATASDLVPGAQVTNSLDELLAIDLLDALIIATPNYRHAEHLRAITSKRTIPILVEKPLVTRADDAALIEDLWKHYDAPIWVAMEYRYMPPVQKFLELIDDATGGVRHLSIREHRFPFLQKVDHWNRFNSRSGGTLVEKCCHYFDLMRLICQAEPARVMGSGWQAVNHLDEVYDGQPSDIWDAAFAIVDFDDGTRGMLDLCMFAEGANYQEEITAVGPRGRIDCLIPCAPNHWPAGHGPHLQSRIVIQPRDRRDRREIEVPVDAELTAAGSHHGSTYYQHLGFRDVLLGKRDPEVSLRDGWRAVAMGMAAQQSSATGQAVSIDADFGAQFASDVADAQ